MSRKWSSNDGVIFAEWEVTSDGRLLRKMIQPTEDRILSSNDELRKSLGALKRLEWGEWIGSIPENIYWLLVKEFPDLNSPNAQARTAAWRTVLNSREYERFRVRPRNMARG